MKKLSLFLNLIRWKNILLLTFIQASICYFLIPKSILKIDFFLIFCSGLVMAGGNLINDFYDLNIDKINKPTKILFTSLFSKTAIIRIYLLINLIILLISWVFLKDWTWFFLSSILLLWLYSSFFKGKIWIGNFIVAFVSSIYLLFLGLFYQEFDEKLLLFSFFSFIMTLIRELIKDMEDIKGDALGNCKTFPIVFGISKSKFLLYFYQLILTGSIACFFWRFTPSFLLILWGILVLILQIILLQKIIFAKNEEDFGVISSFCKKIMFIGTFGIIFT